VAAILLFSIFQQDQNDIYMSLMKPTIFLLILLSSVSGGFAQKNKMQQATEPGSNQAAERLLNGLKFRNVGPAITSGRIIDLAVNPYNSNEYYVASAAGGVWKTTNAGITYNPVFEHEGSYSIGCVTIDPNNTNIVWVGTGENNNQRSVDYGDGVYRSDDGGKTWKNMGLKSSEHIGRIVIDPTNSNTVYVAAYGPLWSSGGERGIYKTTDGGKTWKNILSVSENTGFNEIHMDPRNPNVLYATAHQRQRKVYMYVGGGPESAIYKSTDAGASWQKIMHGMPQGDIGRIGLAVSPANPDILYAIVEANEGAGLYRSSDRGSSWEKQSSYSTAGNYYQRLVADPKNVDKIYALNVYLGVSLDAGKNFKILGEKNKHIDNHIIWVDPANTSHLLVGCDGGLYESYDAAANWQFKPNLPVTQFYKVTTDNGYPFYHIHGGSQDNFSMGGPSRTLNASGITNSDWYFTSIGDGFETQVDQSDPNIVYAQSQYGGLVRYDRKSGEFVDIKPIEMNGESANRWNWDAPLLISQFDNKRLYFGANKIYRTDDRGNSWKEISPDLSRQIDRNRLTIMGKVWSVDAVAKNQSTDLYGNVTTIAESKLDQNLLFAGTDDGLIHITTDGGQHWTKVDADKIPGVPQQTYVNQIIASQHNKNVVYATFNHHRYGDFHPYVYKSTDGGRTWSAIQHNLPERGTAYTIAEDHVNPDLLFVGTEFSVFCSIDGGQRWMPLKGGLPTIAVRDMEIQKRENDLVLATFGRGFYVLDDYSPLRYLQKEALDKPAVIFPVKDALMYIPSMRLGVRGKGFQGESFFAAPNPPVGAVFTYYMRDSIKTLREKRKEAEAEKIKRGDAPYYPSVDTLRMEDVQPEPYLLFTINDEAGNVVRRLKAPAAKGLNRIVWDFRYAPYGPIDLSPFDESFVFSSRESGYLAMPGNYTVSLSKFEDGQFSELAPPQKFKTVALHTGSLPEADEKAVNDFSKKVAELRRVAAAADQYREELANKIKYMKQAILETPNLPLSVSKSIYDLENRLIAVNVKMNGDNTLAKREFETLPSLNGRINNIVGGLWSTTSAPSATYVQSYEIAAKDFGPLLSELRSIGDEVKRLDDLLEKSGAPYTPGRVPVWRQPGS
jgi:photosystem II stability/assembly factor-like uncharacterized protein